ncbi:hypothetical protein POM88_035065 [Heracleum sosnowskyi]|uniref:Uncharacterized protein n=1 Tax=Heracleum sosnowskyi TaxID=360622 RepID=A0AAD8MEA6_9APIA|nr:hypothetical protein POM88_035065 [Heracleum sosnowskyi]
MIIEANWCLTLDGKEESQDVYFDLNSSELVNMSGKEESQDVYFDLNSSELVNVGHLFETDKTFYSRRNLETFVTDVEKDNNIVIVILSSRGGESNGLGNAVLYLGCERSSHYIHI